ncbi:MAG: DinB family protein [Gemmatimonadota bacterium]|nr:MAG: DinB family protein [Gemmatimonadota bacterium]
MDAKQLFFERYQGFREYPEHVVKDLTEDQLRHSPHPSLNPIAWILWHVARCEDVAVNRLLTDHPQVFDEDEWPTRLRVPGREVGTGMSKAHVTQLCEVINLGELDAYRAAVTDRTVAAVAALPLAELTQELMQKRLRQVFVDEGAGGTVAQDIVEAYRGHTKGWLLGHIVLTHPFYHIGQAFSMRAMLGAPNPW